MHESTVHPDELPQPKAEFTLDLKYQSSSSSPNAVTVQHDTVQYSTDTVQYIVTTVTVQYTVTVHYNDTVHCYDTATFHLEVSLREVSSGKLYPGQLYELSVPTVKHYTEKGSQTTPLTGARQQLNAISEKPVLPNTEPDEPVPLYTVRREPVLHYTALQEPVYHHSVRDEPVPPDNTSTPASIRKCLEIECESVPCIVIMSPCLAVSVLLIEIPLKL